jgi:hypothetical protein
MYPSREVSEISWMGPNLRYYENISLKGLKNQQQQLSYLAPTFSSFRVHDCCEVSIARLRVSMYRSDFCTLEDAETEGDWNDVRDRQYSAVGRVPSVRFPRNRFSFCVLIVYVCVCVCS